MYRFNGGFGAVTCDACRVIIDEDLSLVEYEESYNGAMSGHEGDFCWECLNGIKHVKITDAEVEEKLKKRRAHMQF